MLSVKGIIRSLNLLFIFTCMTIAPRVKAARTPESLQATALVTDIHNNTIFQCWSFDSPFQVSAAPGTDGAASPSLATNFSNASYVVLPPNFDAGRHNAPNLQFVIFLAGLAKITLPYSNDSLTLHGGRNGLLVAADIKGTGHITTYPGDTTTIGLQFPFSPQTIKGIPGHQVIHGNGPCKHEKQLIYP